MRKVVFLLIFAVILIAGVVLLFPIIKWKGIPNDQGGGVSIMDNITGKTILMIIAPTDFRDEEYQEPRRVFEEAGAVVKVASKGVAEAKGSYGLNASVDLDVYDVSINDYDAIVFIGGQGAAIYFNDNKVLDLAESFYEQGKVIGAICIAPSILANARILDGKKATAFGSEEQNLTEKGAIYTGEKVTVDGKIITANGPGAAGEFGKSLVETLQQFNHSTT